MNSKPMAMATPTHHLYTFTFLLLILHLTNAIPHRNTFFDAIYQFGDSLSDTGNVMAVDPSGFPCARFPYGATSGRPTGRCSDGLLMADFIANGFGLPFLNPYLDTTADFSYGVNFAVAGATALDGAVLAAQNLTTYNYSLPVELNWFKTHLQSICTSNYDCNIKFQRSLFLMGEIGGNDVNYAFSQGKSIEFIRGLIPDVVQEIKDAIEVVIGEGATYIVVPGNFPIGCVPIYHSTHASNDTSMYDDVNCLKSFNEVAQLQNLQLQQAVTDLQERHPNLVIVYGDYYNAYLWLLKNADALGFEADQAFNPCCGSAEGPCGSEGGPLCANPKTRISWDGVHPTHEANKHMANWLVSHIFNEVSSY